MRRAQQAHQVEAQQLQRLAEKAATHLVAGCEELVADARSPAECP